MDLLNQKLDQVEKLFSLLSWDDPRCSQEAFEEFKDYFQEDQSWFFEDDDIWLFDVIQNTLPVFINLDWNESSLFSLEYWEEKYHISNPFSDEHEFSWDDIVFDVPMILIEKNLDLWGIEIDTQSYMCIARVEDRDEIKSIVQSLRIDLDLVNKSVNIISHRNYLELKEKKSSEKGD